MYLYLSIMSFACTIVNGLMRACESVVISEFRVSDVLFSTH